MSLLIKFTLFAYALASFVVSSIQEQTGAAVEETVDWYIDPSTREFIEVRK